ncbi:hypothetical protein [Eikenella glucosivorans]|nr:hypothetical protein [Eikenella glucosivorans]
MQIKTGQDELSGFLLYVVRMFEKGFSGSLVVAQKGKRLPEKR